VNSRLFAAGIGVAGALVATAAAAPAEDVTLEIQRLPDGRVRFSGRISSAQANEYVTVLAQRCGQASSTAFTGSSTEEGGFWHVDAFEPGSGTYRARWKNQLSEPITIALRTPVRINLTKLPGKRFRVWVFAQSNLSRRFIALQRLAGGRWTHVRRARLVAAGFAGYGGRFEATFAVRKPGLRLRIVVPAKTAAPCHAPAVTETFVS
jgi:hypothetical protein